MKKPVSANVSTHLCEIKHLWMQPLDQNSMILYIPMNILRLHYAWCQLCLCRLWWVWLKCETNGASQRNRAFITMPVHLSVELNAHNPPYLVLLGQRKDLPPQALDVHLFNSQSCESIFRNRRSLSGVHSTIINLSVHDVLLRSKRFLILNEMECKQLHVETTNSLIFPVHHKHGKSRGPSTTLKRSDVDQMDAESIIIDAYNTAIHMLDGLYVLDSLNSAVCWISIHWANSFLVNEIHPNHWAKTRICLKPMRMTRNRSNQ